MSHRYLVGYDGSGPSRRALRWALDHAAAEGGPVMLVLVRNGAEEPGREGEALDRAILEARRGHPLVPVSSTVLTGRIAPALVELAEADDVLVVGTHKTGHLHGRSLGTRALAIAAAAPCTVVVVPDIDQRFRDGVVVGIDLGPGSVELAQQAATEATRMDERLVLVHAEADDRDNGLGGLADRLRQEHPLLAVSTRATASTVAPALLDAALDSALLVIGAPSADPEFLGYGSPVLHDVLINLTAPVLVARPSGAVLARTGAGPELVTGLP